MSTLPGLLTRKDILVNTKDTFLGVSIGNLRFSLGSLFYFETVFYLVYELRQCKFDLFFAQGIFYITFQFAYVFPDIFFCYQQSFLMFLVWKSVGYTTLFDF